MFNYWLSSLFSGLTVIFMLKQIRKHHNGSNDQGGEENSLTNQVRYNIERERRRVPKSYATKPITTYQLYDA